VLIVAPKWNTRPDPRQLGWVEPVSLADTDSLRRLLKPALSDVLIDRRSDIAAHRLQGATDGAPLAGMTTGQIVHLQTIRKAGALIPIVVDAEGEVVLAATSDMRLFLLSDPDLLNTRGLRDLAGARVASALVDALHRAGSGIVFDVTVNGFNTPPSLFKLALTPPFLGATLCLVAAAVLMGLHAVSRFGAPVSEGRVFALGKRALADNSAALIRLAGREPRMAARYADLTRDAVIRALGASRMPADQVDAFLDRVAERHGANRRLAELARAARYASGRGDALAAAQALHDWRLEMTREPQ
jgi:hypothetical protein